MIVLPHSLCGLRKIELRSSPFVAISSSNLRVKIRGHLPLWHINSADFPEQRLTKLSSERRKRAAGQLLISHSKS